MSAWEDAVNREFVPKLISISTKGNLSDQQVKVPVKWLERLIELGDAASVSVHVNPIGSPVMDKTKLVLLKGYIESAKYFIHGDKE